MSFIARLENFGIELSISRGLLEEHDSHSNDSPVALSNPGTPRNGNEELAVVAQHTPTFDHPLHQSSALSAVRNLSSVTANIRQTAPQSKYTQLLAVIEELGKDIRPTYAGSKSSAERLKRGIVHARILVRECLMETERNARS